MKQGQHTSRVAAALARIAAGETAYAVAKDTGISLSYLYRIRKAKRQAASGAP